MSGIKELAVQMSSEYYETGGMTDAVSEATTYLESLLQYGNVDFGGRHIFAGASYDSEAFDSTGAYLGDTIQPEIPVGEGLAVAGGFDGSSALQGTTDIFQVVNDLITALGSNDADAVAGLLGDIDDAQSQLITAQGEVGAQMLKADDALELAESLKMELGAFLG
jgi:flagellar hook-associated protein 3 FlgL